MAYAQPHLIADEDEALEASSRDLTPVRDATSRARRISSAELREIESLRAINAHLLRWLRKKHKRLRGRRKAQDASNRAVRQRPRYFAHWAWVTWIPAVWRPERQEPCNERLLRTVP